MKQLLVNIIVKLWIFMPTRAKVWAYMNDRTFVDPDYHCSECNGKCKECGDE